MAQGIQVLSRYLAGIALVAGLVTVPALAQSAEREAPPDDRSLLEVTVYNGNLAMIRESRKVELSDGVNRLALTGVSPSMQPATASVILRADRPVTFIDQIFAFDLLTPQSLLQHSVGKTVRVIRTNPATGEETVEKAKVLSARNGVVMKIGDRIETGIPGRIVYDSLPPTLREKPTLLATFDATGSTAATLDLRYLTGGITWQADYVSRLDDTGSLLSVEAVATITNNSGASYENATLRLVAGTVNQGSGGVRPMAMLKEARGLAAAAPPVPSAPVGDMHLYPIPHKTTLADRETRQIVLFQASHVPVTKEYRIVGNGGYHTRRSPDPVTVNAQRLLKFTNDEHAGLGVPMPAGTFRVYGGTEVVSDTFLGADQIRHTASGEEVTLTLGTAFDITAKRRQTDFKTQGLPKNTYESSYEITIRNAKDRPETVKVIENLPGDWDILSASYPQKKIASNLAEWTIAIPPKQDRTLTYTVRVKR